MREVECGSRIARVDVYARGAIVTRAVSTEGAVPAGPVVLRVPGLTALAEAGSVRAELSGGREVVSLSTRLVVPDAPAAPGPAIERLRELELAAQALEAERAHLEWRRAALAQRALRSGLDPRDRFGDPAGRSADALAVGGLLATLAAEVDRRLGDVIEALAKNAREREAAELEAAQVPSGDREGQGRPTLEVRIGLSDGAPPEAISVVYAVGAARWWPTTAVRLGAATTRAEWSLGALVAQATGEDWTAVRLALSTADLVHGARLPVLPSQRIGRLQAPPRTGYRAAPGDLDALFEGWDRAMVDLGQRIASSARAASDDTVTRTRFPLLSEDEGEGEHAEVTPVFQMSAPPAARPAPAPLPAAPPAPAGMPAPPSARAKARPRQEAARLAAPEQVADTPAAIGGLADLHRSAAAAPAAASFAAVAQAAAAVVTVDGAIEPADSWLDFDALQLAAPEDPALRGRLVRRGPEGSGGRDAAVALVEALPSPGLTRDPLATRGHFDARWETDGLADVPSDGRPHRVSVARAEGPGRARLRTVPREAAEVYREAWLDNPFDFPLLAGPVDVFVEGALVTTSPMAAVDRGGLVRLGLGVEERVKVARNVSTDEGSAGLLGGSTAVEHLVTIELRSSLGHAAQVEVIDRAPVAGEPDVDVTISSRPEASPYDQAERGKPVRGALRWLVELAPAGEARVELRYRIKLPASSEVVGGNRRD